MLLSGGHSCGQLRWVLNKHTSTCDRDAGCLLETLMSIMAQMGLL